MHRKYLIEKKNEKKNAEKKPNILIQLCSVRETHIHLSGERKGKMQKNVVTLTLELNC